MDCRDCVYMKKFRRLVGGIECRCCHEKAEKLPLEWFGSRGPGFICYVDEEGNPRSSPIPGGARCGQGRPKGSMLWSGTGERAEWP